MVKIRYAALVLAAALLAGCSSADVLPASLSQDEAPALEFNTQESFVTGTVQHGPADEPQYAEDGVTPLPLEYDGGMLTIPYKAYVDGRSGNIGFLFFGMESLLSMTWEKAHERHVFTPSHRRKGRKILNSLFASPPPAMPEKRTPKLWNSFASNPKNC